MTNLNSRFNLGDLVRNKYNQGVFTYQHPCLEYPQTRMVVTDSHGAEKIFYSNEMEVYDA
jgi:hypothetical protein